jgi:fluoride exporter
MLLQYLMIGVGGFLGAVSRFYVSTRVQERSNSFYPYGTLAVNMLGCLLIGFLFGIIDNTQLLGLDAKHLLITGFLGAFTTFSTFGYETFILIRDRRIVQALVNVFTQIIVGILAVCLGYTISSLLI